MNTSNSDYCYKHPQQEAVTNCASCGEPICEYCRKDVNLEDYCPSCVSKKLVKKISLITTVVLLIGVVIGFGGTILKKQYSEPVTFDYGQYADTVKFLKLSLEGQPDSKYTVLELAEFMVRAGDDDGTLSLCSDFQKKYGPYPKLYWVTMDIYKRQAKWDSAAIEATKLIEDAPYDKDFRWWRGEIYEYANQWEKAIEDYTQSLSLQPALSSIPYNLSRALEEAGRGDEAALPLLQLASTRAQYRNSHKLLNRVKNLYRTYNCEKYDPKGEAQILRDSIGNFSTTVTLNDTISGQFLIDLNATHLMMSTSFAERMQLDTNTLKKMIVTTDVTNHDGFVGQISKVQIDNSEASDVAIAVLPSREFSSETYDGIVGLSYLSRFRVEPDYSKGTLHLSSEGNLYF